tara:strand:+ start:242 stop:1291 length:1050 start_codon:yes stop_codon:yes gene_type:complete
MNILSYEIFNKIKNLPSEWNTISHDLNEGITFNRGSKSYKDSSIEIDYQNDTDQDIVRLAQPRSTLTPSTKLPNRLKTGHGNIATYSGYSLEKMEDDIRLSFSEYMKEWESISDSDLKTLINHTYPKDLKNMQVKLLFVAGSGSPLALRVAECIKELYYPKAKIADILKAYYGADIKNAIDWDRYETKDPKTKNMIDTFVKNRGKYFTGHIKKSPIKRKYKKLDPNYDPKLNVTLDAEETIGGLQKGARDILKPGHIIDEYIINAISDEQEKYDKYFKDNAYSRNISMNNIIKMSPKYLLVDDLIVGGVTMRGIFKAMLDTLNKHQNNIPLLKNMDSHILGYTLFKYKL